MTWLGILAIALVGLALLWGAILMVVIGFFWSLPSLDDMRDDE